MYSLGQAVGVAALLGGPLDDFVVHIGEVLHMAHGVAGMLQPAAQHIEGDIAEGRGPMWVAE